MDTDRTTFHKHIRRPSTQLNGDSIPWAEMLLLPQKIRAHQCSSVVYCGIDPVQRRRGSWNRRIPAVAMRISPGARLALAAIIFTGTLPFTDAAAARGLRHSRR